MKIYPIDTIRHSLSHVLALAVQRIFGQNIQFGTGPAVENGFYYDIDFSEPITIKELGKIQKEMEKIISQNLSFQKKSMPWTEAYEFFKAKNQNYKLELLEKIALEESRIQGKNVDEIKNQLNVNMYQLGDFEDLCKGPHVSKTSEIKKGSFKLKNVSGAFWQADENNKMLTRISGYSFKTTKELDDFLLMFEEAKKRDHKKLGRELDLFSFHEESPGSAYWHPKGMIIWNELSNFGQSIRKKYGNLEIQTPQLAKNRLWITSGHWEHYKEDMFTFKHENETYCLKPMDCPFNILIYKTKPRSYKDLPIRYTEIGRVFRNEKSGELNGLLRVNSITQDDAHMFVTEEQIETEIQTLIKMVNEYCGVFGIEPEFFLSTRPDKFLGEIKTWDKAESNLKNALEKEKIEYGLKEKDGAFYGPKIDLNIKDSLGRSWQLATIQLDFQLPQRFEVEYTDKDGKKKTPVMIHAAIFGSFERFIGILTEHYAGVFPVWLSPVQVKILSVGEKHSEFCKKLENEFSEAGFRTELDLDNETVGSKIRKAITEKIPYILVIGDKEVESGKLAVRIRETGKTEIYTKQKFIEEIGDRIKDRK